MKCSEVRHNLSAYFDGELAVQRRGAVAAHVETCQDCRAGLSRLNRLSTLAKNLPDPAPSSSWGAIEEQLSQVLPAVQPVIRTRYGRFAWGWAANVAAVAAVLAIAVYLSSNRQGPPVPQPVMAVNLAQYIDHFETDPQHAQSDLLKQYAGKQVEPQNVFRLVNYKPLAPETLPDGLVRTAMYEIEMPCCKCIQSIYRRGDGGTLAVFEHAGDQPPCFGKHSAMDANCGEKAACLIECNGQLVVSWKEGERFITLVGVKDQAEADRLIPAFAPVNS